MTALREVPTSVLALGLTGLMLALAVLSLNIGVTSVDVLSSLQALMRGEGGIGAVILLEIRLPRTLLAILAGASLGLAGAAMQGLLRNPLAEPGILGVSATAALGAVVAFYYGLVALAGWTVPVGGMAGAFLAVTLLLLLAGRDSSVTTIILAGVAINTFASALTALALNLAPSPYAVIEILFWLLGSLSDRSLDHVWLALPLTLIGWALLFSSGRLLDALTLGEDVARSLGFNLARARLRVVLGAAACVGAAVAVSGAIGFVGLVVPHLLRPLVGYQPGRLLLVSALGGACLLLAADIGVRLVPLDVELKLGVVTALIGAPFFFSLVLALRRSVS